MPGTPDPLDSFMGNEALADSVNHLLVVGFYLINIGYVSVALRAGAKPNDLAEAIEYLSTKIGVVLLVLGVMHFINIRIFSSIPTWRMVRLEGQSASSCPETGRSEPNSLSNTLC